MGRDLLPYEDDPYLGLRDDEQTYNRLFRGQITSVNTKDGIANIDYEKIMGARPHTVPVLWFSATGRTSAWGRYMPMGNEFVDIGFRTDGAAVVVGYDATNTQDGSPGWNVLTKAQRDGNIPGFQTWKELKRGEYDFKSSGDAYIHGSDAGVLSLYGGQAYIKLEKEAYRLSSKANTYKYISGACEQRFGIVYRKDKLTDIDETAVQLGIFQEFLVDVNQVLPTGMSSPASKTKIHFGDILQPITNIPEICTDTGAPLRGRITIGDSVNATDVFTLEIDQLGNIIWNQGTTGIVGLMMAMQNFNMDIGLTGKIKAGISMEIDSPLVNVKSNMITLGDTTAVFLAKAPITDARLSALEAFAKAHVHPVTTAPGTTGMATGAPSGPSTATTKVKGT